MVRRDLTGSAARPFSAAVIEQLEARRLFVNVNGAGFVDVDANGEFGGDDSGFLAGLTVYDDVNFNGQLDPGEPNSTTSIQSQGNWSLNLTPGKHLLRANVPEGYHLSAPASGGMWVDVRSGTLYFIRFGAWLPGRYGVNFYRDRDGNGSWNSAVDYFSTGKSVWADLNDDGVMDPSEPGAAADWGGFASLRLRPGTYRLRYSKPDLWWFTDPGSGSQDVTFESLVSNLPDFTGMTGQSIVRGFAFDDVNGNDRYDSFETPLEGVLAFADLDNDGRLDPEEEWTESDAQGNFGFLMPFGNHATVYVMHPWGGYATSRLLTMDMEHNWEHDLSAAVRFEAQVVGNIYADLDGSGQRNASEPFLPGRLVWTDLDDDGQLDPNEPFTQTEFAGGFRLSAPEGPVRIRTTAGDDYTFGPSGGAFPLLQVSGRGSVYAGELGMLDARPERNRSGAFGFVFNDLDRNGRQDPGERGIPGRTVYADVNNNAQLDPGERSAVSDSAGYYTITELATNKTYIIRQIAPPGWESVYVGNNGGNSVTFGTNPAFGDRHVPSWETGSIPFVTQASFDRETGHELNVQFGRDVTSTIGPYDFVIRNITSGAFVRPDETWQLQTSTEGGLMAVNLRLTSLLADGSYELILRRKAVSDVAGSYLGADYVLPFTVRSGDANGDGKVNIADYLRIDRGFARGAANYSNGDFNYDGVIDGTDYFIIDQAYLAGQAAPPASEPPVTPAFATSLEMSLAPESEEDEPENRGVMTPDDENVLA